jgi:hypothetical protein
MHLLTCYHPQTKIKTLCGARQTTNSTLKEMAPEVASVEVLRYNVKFIIRDRLKSRIETHFVEPNIMIVTEMGRTYVALRPLHVAPDLNVDRIHSRKSANWT